jgi:aminopeptidase YwaD
MHKSIWIVLSTIYSFSFSQKIDYKKFTEVLCSSEFHGRGYVNQGDSLAANYIAQTFSQIGILPLANSSEDYFQSFSFPVHTFPRDLSVQLNSKVLTPGIHFLVDPASSSFSGTLNLNSISITDLYNQQVITSNFPKNTALLIRNLGFGGDTIAKVKQYLQKLANQIPIIEIVNTKLTWSVSQVKLNFPYLIIQDSVIGASPENIAINIDAEFKPLHSTRNVIGYIPSARKNAKTLVFSAHYDHLGRMGNDVYFPGGNDNASGSAMLVFLANYFKEHASKYNLVFIAFAGEEVGLLGSQYFVSHPLIKLKDIRFLINLDIMGSGEEGITAVNGTLFEKEFLLLQKINKKQKALPVIKKRGPAANSDHYFFTEAGVPSFFIYTMGPNKNYHDVNDTYENLSFKAFEKIGELLIAFTHKLN